MRRRCSASVPSALSKRLKSSSAASTARHLLAAASITVAQEPTFRTGTQIVSVVTTVTDSTFSRQPNVAGDDGVIYGEAAGKLIKLIQARGGVESVERRV